MGNLISIRPGSSQREQLVRTGSVCPDPDSDRHLYILVWGDDAAGDSETGVVERVI